MVQNKAAEPKAAAAVRHRATTAELFPNIYVRLCELGGIYLRRRGSLCGSSPEGLVHEAFIHLADRGDWNDSAHLLGVAARTMKEILVDRQRRRLAAKRGGGQLAA